MHDERRAGMSLFALRKEYQRTFDRIFEDFSLHTRAQTEPFPNEVESTRHQSVISLDNQHERHEQYKTQNAITPPVAAGCEFIHHDVKAWARFLDSKRKQ
jgi:hypothetical protein